MDEPYRPRPGDEIVEPLFAALGQGERMGEGPEELEVTAVFTSAGGVRRILWISVISSAAAASGMYWFG
ncbi:MAG: hypothetical protein ACI841_001720 [Planctomycetota bacterium]|jgi:hypothetical protein